jgi:hypothetical protein
VLCGNSAFFVPACRVGKVGSIIKEFFNNPMLSLSLLGEVFRERLREELLIKI